MWLGLCRTIYDRRETYLVRQQPEKFTEIVPSNEGGKNCRSLHLISLATRSEVALKR